MAACLTILAVSGLLGCADTPVQVAAPEVSAVVAGTDSVALTYICGNMFRIRNSSFEPRSVRWDIYNASPADTGSLWARGRDVARTSVDFFVTARTKGTMRLFVGTTLVSTKANGNKVACAAPVDTTPFPTVYASDMAAIGAAPLITDTDSTTYWRTIVRVRFKEGISASSRRSFQARHSAQLVGVYSYYLHFRLADPGNSSASFQNMLGVIQQDSVVYQASGREARSRIRNDAEAIYPSDGTGRNREDYILRTPAVWHATALRLPQAWACENGTYSMVSPMIAIFEHNFPAIAASDVRASLTSPVTRYDSWRASAEGGPPSNVDSAALAEHGHFVAAILSAKGDNATGMAGVLWRSDLRVFSLENIENKRSATEVPFYNGILPKILAAAPRVLSISSDFGPYKDTIMLNEHVEDSKDIFRRMFAALPDLLLVKAANNDTLQGGSYRSLPVSKRTSTLQALLDIRDSVPALRDRIVIVGATTLNGNRATFSNDIPGAVDLYAPGEDIIDLDPNGNAVVVRGTSFAAPIVAGIAGQLLAMDPTLSAKDLKELLLRGAEDSVENANGDNIAPSRVGNTADVVYEADAYGSLRLLSKRTGTPLCGAIVTAKRAAYPRFDYTPQFSVAIRRYQASIDETITADAGGAPLLWPVNYSGYDAISEAPGGRTLAFTSAQIPNNSLLRVNTATLVNRAWQSTAKDDSLVGLLYGERDTLRLDNVGATFATATGRLPRIPWPDQELEYQAGRVAMAPDGSRFAYAVHNANNAHKVEVVVVNRAGQAQRITLATGAEYSGGPLSFTPDGREIVASVRKEPPGTPNQPPYNEYYVGTQASLYRISAGPTLAVQTSAVVLPFFSFSFLGTVSPTSEGGRVRVRVVGELVRPFNPNAFGDPLYLVDCSIQSFSVASLGAGNTLLQLSPSPCQSVTRGFYSPGGDIRVERFRPPGIAY